MTGPLKTPTQKTFRTGIWKTRILESWGFCGKTFECFSFEEFFSLAKLLKGFYGLGFFRSYTEKVVETVEIQERILGEINGNIILIHNYET